MHFSLLSFGTFNDSSLPDMEGPTMRFTPAKTAATAAALVVCAGLFAAAPAQSQTANFENLMKVAAQTDTISCPDLKKQLDKTGSGGNNAPAPSNRTPGVPAPARPAAPGPALPANPVDQIVN